MCVKIAFVRISPPWSEMESILELREVSKHYPTHRAVHNVSLTVDRGAFYSILGPSGCGKTTTLRMIAGFDEPTSGEVRLNGKSIQHLRPYERPINTVFQRYALFPHLTVAGNVEFGLKRRGMQDCAAKVRNALDLVQLTGKETRMPSQLSGGEQQRVALARSLVLEPEVLLLDEPLSALDPNLRKSVRAELKSLQRRTGITFVFITHDQEEALSLSDRIAVMNKGEVEQIGSPQDIYLRPATPFVAGFMGAVNWIDAKIGVRPESTKIGREAPGNGAKVHSAQVKGAVFLGNCIHVETLTQAGSKVVAELPCDDGEAFREGDSVYVWWHSEDELRFQG
jgi:spermidine/putrescine transport system ATP-binding protein